MRRNTLLIAIRLLVALNFLAAIFFKFGSIRVSRERRYAFGRASIACPT